MADRAPPTGKVAEFSSKWRVQFSHLRGESENHTVVHNRCAARGALEAHDVVAVTMRDFEDWLARHNAFGNALIWTDVIHVIGCFNHCELH
jgi:hypothetical protein